MQISRPLWASKPECDAHICLNLGFASQSFRLTEVSPGVCYFWSSPSRMDEGNTLPSEQLLCSDWKSLLKSSRSLLSLKLVASP
jgi:hypothetical protein